MIVSFGEPETGNLETKSDIWEGHSRKVTLKLRPGGGRGGVGGGLVQTLWLWV